MTDTIMKELQRTAAWQEKRKGRVTGSMAGAALGLCPWRSPDDVIRQMVREYHGAPSEFTGNVATEWGVQHERAALLAFMRETGLHVEDCGFFTYDDWSGASPDGITSDDAVLEIKVPFSLRNGGEFKPLAEQPHYYAQVQLEMLAAVKRTAYFYQYIPERGDIFSPDHVPAQSKLETIHWDQYWIDIHLPLLREFYDRYLSELDNPAHLEEKRVTINTDEAQAIVNRIGELDDHIAAMTEERKDALQRLVDMAGGKDALICNKKLTLIKRKGSINFKKILEDAQLEMTDEELDKWRGKSSESWRFT